MADTPLGTQRAAETHVNRGKLSRDLFIRRVGKVGLVITPLVSYFFLWAPIVVLIVFSFNDSPSVSVWQGLTTRWYQNIFAAGGGGAGFVTGKLLESLGNSLIVAFSASLLATVIGTMLALAIHRGKFPRQARVGRASLHPRRHPRDYAGRVFGDFFSHPV